MGVWDVSVKWLDMKALLIQIPPLLIPTMMAFFY